MENRYTLAVPFAGFVDIQEGDMKMRFSEQELKTALSRAEGNPKAYASRETQQYVIGMYKDALKLLEEEKA